MFWSRQCPAYVLGEDTPPWALTLYPFIHHFWQKWYLFHIPSIDKCYPFHIPSLEHFNCCNCTILLICVNNKNQEVVLSLHSHKVYICWPFLSFHRAKWQVFLHRVRNYAKFGVFYSKLVQMTPQRLRRELPQLQKFLVTNREPLWLQKFSVTNTLLSLPFTQQIQFMLIVNVVNLN